MAFTRPKAAQIDFDITNITDPLIRLNSGQSGANDKDVGIVIERGNDTNVAIIYDESADQFVLVNTTEDGSTSGNVTISSYAGLQANAIVYGSLNDGTTTLTATVAELNYVDGVTSNIQTQLDAKSPIASPTFTGTATGVNLTLSGDLTVNGTTTTVNTTNLVVSDSLIELNNGASSNANDLGIVMERGSTGDNAIIAWDESADKFIVGTTTATGATTGDLSITTGTLVANIEGNVTGDVTGNTSGSSGSTTGNAATATALATTRAIQVSGAVTGTANFDGSAAINIVTTATSDPTITLGGDLSGSVTLTNLASGTLTATVGTLNQNTTGTAATVTTAAQPNITSVGTLTALQVDNININGNTISSTAGTDLLITPLAGQQIVLDGAIVIDAGVVTGATSITSTAFVGALTGNVTGNTSGSSGSTTGNAATATKLATTRAIQVSGAVTGTANFDGSAAINIVTTATNDPVLTLAGDATGSATFTNLGNATLTVAVVDDSHSHNQTTLTGVLPLTGGTLTGVIAGFESTGIDDNASSTAVTIDSSGNVGIGTTAPSSRLEISSAGDNTNVIVMSQGAGYKNSIQNLHSGSASNARMSFFVHDSSTTQANVMSLLGNGNVGIGTTAPSNKLDVSGDIGVLAQNEVRFYDTDSSNYVSFRSAATVASNIVWTLPNSDGTADQVLKTNGAGTLSWADQSGDGGGGGSSYPNSTITTLPGTEGNYDLAKNGAQTITETPFEAGGTDAFGVNLGTVFSLMDPVGSVQDSTGTGLDLGTL